MFNRLFVKYWKRPEGPRESEEKRPLKFGRSEKHTKFEKIFLMVLTNQLIYVVNVKTMRKTFSNYTSFSKRLTHTKKGFNYFSN